MSIFSPAAAVRSLLSNTAKAFMRFPVPIAFSVALTAYAVIWIFNGYHNFLSPKAHYFLSYWLSTSIPASMAITLLAEDIAQRRRRIVVNAAGLLLWTALWAAMTYAQSKPACSYYFYGESALILAAATALFVAPFVARRHSSDIPFWNFTTRTVGAVATSYVISLLLMLGIFLLLASFTFLFGVDVSDKAYFTTAAVCHLFLAPLLTMQLVPSASAKHDPSAPVFTSFGKSAVHYLFMPLVAAYLVTLYAYSAKILFSWQLPCGWVSWLVTGVMASAIMLASVSYPLFFNGQHKRIDSLSARFLPLLILPLLVLMSVAIGRRIADYGITTARVYVVIFNVWCYAVCIFMFCTRSRRIMPIFSSFALIALLTSLSPFSVNDFVCRHIAAQLKQSMFANGVTKLPVNNQQYSDYLNRLPQDARLSADSQMEYLQFHHRAYYSLCDSSVVNGMIGITEEAVSPTFTHFAVFSQSSEFSVPQGAKLMVIIDTALTGNSADLCKPHITFTRHTPLGTVSVPIDTKRLRRLCNDNTPHPYWIIAGNGGSLTVTNLYFRPSDDSDKPQYRIDLSGKLFVTEAPKQPQNAK